MENVFGRVVDDTASKAASTFAGNDSTKDSAAQAAEAVPETRPFTGMLVQLGRDIGVASENVDKLRSLLQDPEVQQVSSSSGPAKKNSFRAARKCAACIC